MQERDVLRGRIGRRDLLKLGVAVGAPATLLSACAPPDEEIADPEAPDAPETPVGDLLFLSTQLTPVEEAEAMRNVILADFDAREVDFLPEEIGPFIDRVTAEAQAGQMSASVLGSLHGDLATLADRDLLVDISDLAEELADRGFVDDFMELARLGRDGVFYIPWMQATYIMAARQEALEHLPDGADLQALTYDDWAQWGANITEATGSARLGFPASEDGLIHRFFQGYAYPSFTGALNTRFRGAEAVDMWEWMRSAWEHAHPQSVAYGFMQEPLLGGEVLVGWDHTARLIDALRGDPDNIVAFPSPTGPAGLGYMPVVAGLAIPVDAPDPEGARDLIRYLTQPDVASTTLEQVAFFPPFEADLPGELDPGIQAQADAVAAQSGADDTIPSLLPVGLGEQAGTYNDVFRNTFERITLRGEDLEAVLESEGDNLQAALDAAEAACWPPDPDSGEDACQVG